MDINRDDLQSYFEKSIAVVHAVFENVEYTYIRRGKQYTMQRFQDRPITTTFLSIFALLSFLPIVSFIGFSLFVVGATVFVALMGAAATSSAVVLMSAGILSLVLASGLFIAVLFTISVVGSFSAVRLILLVQANGPRSGLIVWVGEMTRRLRSGVGSPADGSEPNKRVDIGEHKSEKLSEGDEIVVDDARSDITDTSTIAWTSQGHDGSGKGSPVLVKQEVAAE